MENDKYCNSEKLSYDTHNRFCSPSQKECVVLLLEVLFVVLHVRKQGQNLKYQGCNFECQKEILVGYFCWS